MRSKKSGTRPRRNAERRSERRIVKTGFPIAARPFLLAEIRDYFSGDTITCLLCGRSLKRLSASHLHRIHSMREDEYRARYGLPWRRGLTSQEAHDNYSRAVMERIENGEQPLMTQPMTPEIRALLANSYPHRTQPFRAELARRNVLHMQKCSDVPYDKQEAFAGLLRMIDEGKTPKEAMQSEGFPSQGWFHRNLSAQQWRDIKQQIWSKDFAYQARAQHGMSPAFATAIRERRPASDRAIANALGVTTMTVNRHRRKLGIP